MQKARLEHLMKQLASSFLPEKSDGMEGVFQCHVPGEEGGDWIMTVANQNCQITPGIAPNPRATLTIDGTDLDELLSGKLDPLRAFFSGRIQLSGENAAAIKLISMFRLDPKSFS